MEENETTKPKNRESDDERKKQIEMDVTREEERDKRRNMEIKRILNRFLNNVRIIKIRCIM